MIRSVLCAVLMALSFNALALDEASSIPEDQMKVINAVVQELGLPAGDRSLIKELHGAIEHVFKPGWYSYWVGNADLEKARFKSDKIRIFDLIIPSDERVNNVTLTYFPAAKQIFYVRRQFVEGSSASVMEMFRKSKEDAGKKKFKESDYYAFFQREGYLDFEVFHIKTPNAAATYIDYGLIDVK